MSVFDTDLVQKDLPLEDILREKITGRVEGVVYAINERSAHGVTQFKRLTERGTYGIFDRDWEWGDRYPAFMDYLRVSLKCMIKDMNDHPMRHNDCKVIMDDIAANSNFTTDFTGDQLKVTIQLRYHTLWQHILSWKRQDYTTVYQYNIHLDPPTCPPEGLRFPFVI